MTTTATTRLEAVNIMLSVLGESPVNSLSGNSSASVAMAEAILDETDKEMQLEGWHFNTETDVELAPDVNGNINVPSNVVRIDTAESQGGTADVTVRSGKVYDKTEKTDVFTGSMKFECVYLLAFTDLPEAARHYVIVRAARKLQDRLLGAQEHHAYNMRDEQQARARLQDFEGETGDYTIFDNGDTARVIARKYPDRNVI